MWKIAKAARFVSSPITRRVYNVALDEFIAWFKEAPRPGFSKATVSAWRVSLEAGGLGSSSMIIRMSAIRKLAAEAADNGLLDPELAADISRVKSVKSCFSTTIRSCISLPVIGHLNEGAKGGRRFACY